MLVLMLMLLPAAATTCTAVLGVWLRRGGGRGPEARWGQHLFELLQPVRVCGKKSRVEEHRGRSGRSADVRSNRLLKGPRTDSYGCCFSPAVLTQRATVNTAPSD